MLRAPLLVPEIIHGLNVKTCSAGTSHTVCVLETGHTTSFGLVEGTGYAAPTATLAPHTIFGVSNVETCTAGDGYTVL